MICPRRRTAVVHRVASMLVLASGSEIRASLLRAAGLDFDTDLPRIDEERMKLSLAAEDTKPRDIAEALAETKARKVAGRRPGDLVLGCDQVLDLGGRILSKPDTPETARAQLAALSGQRHLLHSAVVAHEGPAPVWRHVGTARLAMRPLSARYIDAYVARNWDSVRHAVGSYKLEEEGMRLFSAIDGDKGRVGFVFLQIQNIVARDIGSLGRFVIIKRTDAGISPDDVIRTDLG